MGGFHIIEPCNKDLVHMTPVSLTIGLLCLVGTIFSIIPQHLKIARTKTVAGISPLSLLIGNVALLTNFLNSLILKWKQLEKCSGSFWKCQPSMILLYTNFAIFVGMLPIYYWLVIMPNPRIQRLDHSFRALDDDGKAENKNPGGKEDPLLGFVVSNKRSEYHSSLLFNWNCQLYGSIILIVGSITWSIMQPCIHVIVVFAGCLGFFSSLCQAVRFIPQLYKSIISEGSGSVSYLTFLVQGLGGFLNVYFQIFASKEQLTTWLPLMISNCFQVLIIIINLINDVRFKRCWWNESSQEDLEDGEEDNSPHGLKTSLLDDTRK